MCAKWSVLLIMSISSVTVNPETESLEDPYTFSIYDPAALNFREIQTSFATSTEDKTESTDEIPTTTEERSLIINKDQSQYVEFHPELTTEPPTQPPPKFILNSSFIGRSSRMKKTTTTEEPDDMIKVVPMKNIQRGLLDLLFPETRVKSFKNMFDTVKRMLSHTFRR